MTPRAVSIGRARPEELPDILALLERCGLVTTGLADHLEATLVARTGGRLVGSAALEMYGSSALLRSVAVEDALRGRGIGQRLTQQALALARRRGVATVYLLTETAAGFYPRFGFRPIPREQVAPAVQRSVEFTSACPATAQAMAIRTNNREETPMTDKTTDPGAIREAVREHYGQVAKASGETCGCSSDASCCGGATVSLYGAGELAGVPAEAQAASAGCGNPVALASLKPGEVVLDLGSGGGIDVFLAAQRVGPEGFAYGVDMTEEMLALARRNAERVGANNVRFLKGDLEAIPLPDRSVDVIISNCVINLTPDKSRALREAFRVLRPGGRLAVSDIVVDGDFKGLPISEERIRSALSWAGCIAGALTVDDYRRLLAEAGFQDIAIEPKRLDVGAIPDNLPDALLDLPLRVIKELMRRFASASISAVRSAEAT